MDRVSRQIVGLLLVFIGDFAVVAMRPFQWLWQCAPVTPRRLRQPPQSLHQAIRLDL
jgi:hypothetical protein